MTDPLASAPTVSPLTSPTAVTLVTTAAGAALQTWGSYALCLIALGLMLWRAHLREAKLEAENAALRVQYAALQDKRLEDARELIRLTEKSTETQIARTQGDQTFAQLMESLVRSTQGSQEAVRENRQILEEMRETMSGRRPPARGSR